MTTRILVLAAALAVLACGGGDDSEPAVTAGCNMDLADLCIGRSGPAAQVEAEMQLCTAPSVPVASCPTAGLVGSCRQTEGQMAEITYFYAPTWTPTFAQATCDPPDVWSPAP